MTVDKAIKRAPLMSLDEALRLVLKDVSSLTQIDSVNTFEADGRVLAEDLVSHLQVPPQDNSSMDGYALRIEDLTQAGTSLKVTQRIPAGQHGHALGQGEAARIFTGAPIPAGANAVVMQEDTQALVAVNSATGVPEVLINTVPMAGQWIRRSGEDVARGDRVLVHCAAGLGRTGMLVAKLLVLQGRFSAEVARFLTREGVASADCIEHRG